MKAIDLTGQRFGKLMILNLSSTSTPSGERMWNCICDCGNYKTVQRKHLRSGFTKTCGCGAHLKNKEHKSWKGYEDIPKDFYSNIKRGAVERNIEFDITIEDLWKLFLQQNKKCALSGIELTFSKIRKDTTGKTISLDRIDSSIGYIKGNIQFVHKHINIMKNSFDQDYFISLCEQIINHNKTKNNGMV
jgi:hypothetical protein